jgi:predicted ATP-grasp superfamily ATP-dependent carboligase
MTSHKRIGAVVIGGDYQGLGIVRSLGRRGIPVCVVDDEYSIARFSRFATQAVRVSGLRAEDSAVSTLLELGHRLHLDGWVLYPTRDETVAALSRRRSELLESFRVPTPDWQVVRWAWDKRNTYRLAGELGIPTPRTWYPQDAGELEEIDVNPPLAIKPAIKRNFLYATKAKAFRADSRSDLKRLFHEAAALVGPGEVMVQELIPGDGKHQFAYCTFFRDGSVLASMTVCRRRQHPPEFGRASTFVETVAVPEIESMSEQFLRAIGYYGLVELEYKLDSRDGRYKLLDVNARTWGYHSIGWQAGVDFPYLLYADQMGWTVDQCRAQAGVTWVRFVTDLPTALVELWNCRLSWRAYVQSLRTVDVEAVFSRDDFLPAVAEVLLIPYLALKRGF